MISLSSILAIRLLGLMMILPILSLHAPHYLGASATTIGLALGIYGLTQALCQMPLGMLSDYIGRKTVLVLGLLLLILGSLVCAHAHHMVTVVVGRALQGACAIGSTIMASVADLTRPEKRTQAMGIMGAVMGLAFSMALFLGPFLDAWVGLNGIFWTTALLSLGAVLMVFLWVPPIPPAPKKQTHPLLGMVALLKSPALGLLSLGIFSIHALFVATFTALPLFLSHDVQLAHEHLGYFYLPILLCSFISVAPIILWTDKHTGKTQKTILCCGLILMMTEWVLWLQPHQMWVIVLFLWLFFTAFALLEALLPARVSTSVHASTKGTAMGMYATAQFLGIFFGGFMGGLVQHHSTLDTVFLCAGMLMLPWVLMLLCTHQKPLI